MMAESLAKQMIAAASHILRPFPRFHTLIKSKYYQILGNQWQRAQSQLLSFCATAVKQEANPFFVKVGANDGVTGDPLGDLLIDNPQWRGILIEPVDDCFHRLQKNYSDFSRFTLLRVAVGDAPSVTTFYYVDEAAKRDHPSLPSWYDQLGSFSKQHILNHLDGILEPYIREQEVRVQRLDGILHEQGVRAVSLLHIDTEGADLQVLESLDFNKVRPRAILIEHKHLVFDDKQKLRAMLKDQGYRVYDCGSDFFARG